MIIFDIEGSGIDADVHGILSIGAYDFNDPTRSFYEECKLREGAHVLEEAQKVNGYTFEQMNDQSKQSEKELVEHFIEWAMQGTEHTLVAQNPAFDTSFVKAVCKRNHLEYPFPHRTIDVHTVCFTHMMLNGSIPPIEKGRTALDSDTIMNYVGIPAEPHPHIAINGAKYETEALSRLLNNKSFFEEFKQYPIPWVK